MRYRVHTAHACVPKSTGSQAEGVPNIKTYLGWSFCVKTLYQHMSDYQWVRRYAHFNVPKPVRCHSYEPPSRLLHNPVNTTPPLLAGLACEVTGPLLLVAAHEGCGVVHRRQENFYSQSGSADYGGERIQF